MKNSMDFAKFSQSATQRITVVRPLSAKREGFANYATDLDPDIDLIKHETKRFRDSMAT
jgi:hypothetical protein